MPHEYIARRERVAAILLGGVPRITSQPQLLNILQDEGFTISTRDTIQTDLASLGAFKVKPPDRGKEYYILPTGEGATKYGDEAVAYEALHRHLWNNGNKIVDVTGLTPLLITTNAEAAPLVAAPLSAYRPEGVEAVVCGREGVLLFVEPDRAERVQQELAHLMNTHP